MLHTYSQNTGIAEKMCSFDIFHKKCQISLYTNTVEAGQLNHNTASKSNKSMILTEGLLAMISQS